MEKRSLSRLVSRSVPAPIGWPFRFGPRGARISNPPLRRPLAANDEGAAVLEAAIALPVVALILLGILQYGMWFMAAHSLQQSANEAARMAVAGINADDRAKIVSDSLAGSVAHAGTLNAKNLKHSVKTEGKLLKIRLEYDTSKSGVFSASIVPMPASPIVSEAIIQLETI